MSRRGDRRSPEKTTINQGRPTPRPQRHPPAQMPHNLPKRKSIRLPDYDYTTPGAYHVIICTHKHECLFGEITDGVMRLNAPGLIVVEEWKRSSEIRREIGIDMFMVMPNHFHGIVIITNPNAVYMRATSRSPLQRPVIPKPRGPKPKSLGAFIAGFKSAAAKRINILRNTPNRPVWQRSYYEHVVRNENELNRIREYMLNNPLRWEIDRNNPDREI